MEKRVEDIAPGTFFYYDNELYLRIEMDDEGAPPAILVKDGSYAPIDLDIEVSTIYGDSIIGRLQNKQ